MNYIHFIINLLFEKYPILNFNSNQFDNWKIMIMMFILFYIEKEFLYKNQFYLKGKPYIMRSFTTTIMSLSTSKDRVHIIRIRIPWFWGAYYMMNYSRIF